VGLLALCPLASQAQSRTELRNHVAPLVNAAADLGATNASQQLTLTLQLNGRDSTALDRRLQAIYDPASAYYHRWLSVGEAKALSAPAAADVAALHEFLANNRLQQVSAGPGHITVRGSVADAERSFGVSIHDFRTSNGTRYANVANPSVPANLAGVVSAVTGLSEHRMQSHLVHARTADGQLARPVPLASVPNGFFFSAQCFRAAQTQVFTSATARATYRGNRYGQDIANGDLGTLPPCGYQPSDWQTAYGLDKLYQRGLDGTGTTVAIVDAFGSQTIQYDVDTFSQLYGLPPADLTVIGTPTGATYSTDANLAGWAEETTLDVEWVHAIAPGAKIVLVVSPDNFDVNLSAAVAQAVTLPGVVVVSNSYGGPETTEDAPGFAAFEAANKLGAALGVSVNYSSGDSGDFSNDVGYVDVSYPSGSPWATSVGGTSLALNSDGSIAWQTGWGNNITRIADTAANANAPLVPPLALGFNFGGGGGTSTIFHKPRFQNRLSGNMRQQPDISWLADPYTGVELILSADDAGNQAFTAIGGTSLSCPAFSALWAIAAQRAGHPLGLAARSVYRMGPNAIQDVQPVGSRNNVTGVIRTGDTQIRETAADLAQVDSSNGPFFSALYNSPYSTRWFVLSFGTDTSLTVRRGWDNVTGLGTPNGQNFVEAAAHLDD
jgi:subtilase family serine protease